jgi:hypothetical protein
MVSTPTLNLINPITKSVPDLTGEIRQAGNTISSFVDDIAKYKKEVQEKNDKQLLEVGARSYYDTDNKDLQTMSHAIYQQTMDKLIENEKKVKRNWAGVPQYNNLKYKSDNQEILQDALNNVSYLRTIDDYWKEAQKENAKNPNANDINSGAAIYNWFIDKNKTKEGKWSLTRLPTEGQGGFDINGNYIPTKVDNPNYGNVPVMNPKENTWPKTIGSTQQGTAGMGGVIAENKPDDNKTIPNPESNKILWHPGMGGTNPFLIPKPVTNWEKEIKGYVTNDGEEQIKGETKKVGDVDVTVNKTVKSNYKPETAALGIWKSLNDKSVPQQSVTVKHTLNQLDKEPEKLTQYENDYSNIFSKPETELNPFESEIRKAGNSEPTRNKYLVARANADSAITTREINKQEEKPHKYPKTTGEENKLHDFDVTPKQYLETNNRGIFNINNGVEAPNSGYNGKIQGYAYDPDIGKNISMNGTDFRVAHVFHNKSVFTAYVKAPDFKTDEKGNYIISVGGHPVSVDGEEYEYVDKSNTKIKLTQEELDRKLLSNPSFIDNVEIHKVGNVKKGEREFTPVSLEVNPKKEKLVVLPVSQYKNSLRNLVKKVGLDDSDLASEDIKSEAEKQGVIVQAHGKVKNEKENTEYRTLNDIKNKDNITINGEKTSYDEMYNHFKHLLKDDNLVLAAINKNIKSGKIKIE